MRLIILKNTPALELDISSVPEFKNSMRNDTKIVNEEKTNTSEFDDVLL